MGSASRLAAVAGYPHLTVPMGQVQGLPVGMSFIGAKWDDARILSLGHAFELLGRNGSPVEPDNAGQSTHSDACPLVSRPSATARLPSRRSSHDTVRPWRCRRSASAASAPASAPHSRAATRDSARIASLAMA